MKQNSQWLSHVRTRSKTAEETSAPTEGPRTQSGVVVGTIAYVSPEQARGEDLDGRSDVFAFGCVLYEILTGRRAFPAAAPLEALASILRDEPREPSALGVPLSPEVDGILRRAAGSRPILSLKSLMSMNSSA